MVVSVDTRNKRASCLGLDGPYRQVFPSPSGGVTTSPQRAQVAYSYAAGASTPTGVVPFRIGNLLGGYGLSVTTYLRDLFAGTDGVSIDSRPMNVGPGWSIASGGNFGGWVLDSGRARETGTLPITASIAISDAGVSSGIVGATVNIPAIATDSAIGVLARMSANFQNGWLGWVDVFDQRIVISERTSGFFVLRAQIAAALSYDTDYSLSFTCSGSSLTLTVAGVGSVSYISSADMTNTNFGIYADSAPGQFVSNFFMRSPTSGSSGNLRGG